MAGSVSSERTRTEVPLQVIRRIHIERKRKQKQKRKFSLMFAIFRLLFAPFRFSSMLLGLIIGVFPKCFTEFSVKNIFHYSKRTRSCHLLCKRSGCCEKQDLKIELNSCFSDLSDSLNLLNSLNSMKVLLYLEKLNWGNF